MTQNLIISRCCFAEDGKEMYKDSQRTCTAIVLLIKPFVDVLAAVVVMVCLSSLLTKNLQYRKLSIKSYFTKEVN